MCHYYTKQKRGQRENFVLSILLSLQSVEGTGLFVADVLLLPYDAFILILLASVNMVANQFFLLQ